MFLPDDAVRAAAFSEYFEPADVAALAVHLMTNTALTSATYDVDGRQQLPPAN